MFIKFIEEILKDKENEETLARLAPDMETLTRYYKVEGNDINNFINQLTDWYNLHRQGFPEVCFSLDKSKEDIILIKDYFKSFKTLTSLVDQSLVWYMGKSYNEKGENIKFFKDLDKISKSVDEIFKETELVISETFVTFTIKLDHGLFTFEVESVY